MKLSQISSEPQLVEVTIDDKAIVKKYGEPLTFYTWDRQPIEVFTKLANLTESDNAEIISIMKTLILDEEGKPVIDGKNTLPMDILLQAIQKVTEQLGN